MEESEVKLSENLAKSEVVVARILQHLMDQGLQNVGIVSFNDLKLDQDYEIFFGGCFKWLISEGLVRVGNVVELLNGTFRAINPVLTAKGLAILGKTLLIENEETTVALVVRETSKGNSSYGGVGDFLGSVLGGFTKSLGSG